MDHAQEVSEDNEMVELPDVAVNQDTESSAATNSKKYACEICPYSSNKAQLVEMHKICHKYQPGNRFKCKYCPYFVSVIRCLYQHMRLHPEHKEQSNSNMDPSLRIGEVSEESRQAAQDSIDFTLKAGKISCNQCPFVCKSRNGIIYHKQFHRERPGATIKCPQCPYWVEHKHQNQHHQKVHTPSYLARVNASSMVGLSQSSVPMGSPAKSDMADYCDSIEMATLKQQIINSKVRSCPLSPEKFTPFETGDDREGKMDFGDSDSDRYTMQGYVVDDNGQVLKSGSLRKVHVCSKCPYTNVKIANLKLHESMHNLLTPKPEVEPENLGEEGNQGTVTVKETIFKCEFCSYNTLKKKLLSKHINVHSQQYEPGRDDIIDFETPTFPEGDQELAQPLEDVDDDPEIQLKRPAEPIKVEPIEPIIKRPKVSSGPRLNSGQVPTHFYVKEDNGEHFLERVSVHKFNCDRCPYATLVRLNFERHVLLHGCKQRFMCEFCDYSVPNFQLLLQHKKLHLMPNPNLLSMQSLSNLQKLPEISADVAAAANFPMNKDDPISTEGVHDHLPLFENSDDFIEPKQMYRCDRCPFTHTHKENLLAHLKYHLIRNALLCSYCDFSAAKQEGLAEHVKSHFSNDKQLESVTDNVEVKIDIDGPATVTPSTMDCSMPNGEYHCPRSEDSTSDKQKTDNHDISKTSENNLENLDYSEFLALQQDDNNNGDKMDNEIQGQGKVEMESASCVCQYCDRLFQSSVKREKHEKQHLVGQKH